MTRYRLTLSTPLDSAPDPEARFQRFPSSYTIKGMFFSRPIEILGADYNALLPQLKRPQSGGRYLAFRDYPQEDYSRISHAAATRRWPHVSVAEAMRQLARDDIRIFGASRLGRVVLAMTGDVTSSLLKLPEMYGMSLKGGEVTAETVQEGVKLEFRDFLGWVDCYPVGTVEGLVLHYGQEPEVEIECSGEGDATYLVRWH